MTRAHWPLGLVLALGGCVEIGGDDGGSNGGTAADDGDGGGDGGGDGAGDDGGGDGAGPPPSDTEVQTCQMACDELLFFDCVDAGQHEACYGVCPERTPADIDLFYACVDNTLPSCSGCYEAFIDAEPVGDDDSGSAGGASCTDACEEWLGAGCQAFGDFDSCDGFCGSIPDTLHDFVAECVAARDGCTLPEECIFDAGGSSKGG